MADAAGTNGNGKGFFRIVNWRRCQRYQKNNPPWVKLYTSLMTDDGTEARWHGRARWEALGVRGQALLVNLWLYAAVTTTDGRLWGDPEFLAAVLPYDGPLDLAPLFAGGFLEWVNGNGSPRKPESEPESEAEGEAEGEGEGEGERESLGAGATGSGNPDGACAGGSGSAAPRVQREAEPEAARQSQTESTAGTAPSIIESTGPPPAISAVPPFPPISDQGQAAIKRGSRLVGVPGCAGQPPPVRAGPLRLLRDSLPEVLQQIADPVRCEWIRQVYERLAFRYPMDSPLGRQELGAFGSLYDELMDLPLPAADKAFVLEHDLETARLKGRQSGHRRRGAVFTAIHHGRVVEYLRRRGRGEAAAAYMARHRRGRYNDSS